MLHDVERQELPETFHDGELIRVIKGSENDASAEHSTFNHTLGLLYKVYKALKRLTKRGKYSNLKDNIPFLRENVWRVYTHFIGVNNTEIISSMGWTKENLYMVAKELALKCRNINGRLVKLLNDQPLYPPHPSTGQLQFTSSFISEVREYHASLQRPDGTFCYNPEKTPEVARLPRVLCPMCGSRRQLYCGECGGIRMPHADPHLPPRIQPPFDIHLLLHWYVAGSS